ncbi:MAG: hypothetical protein WKG03_06890 [Telluria sp.]
MFISTYGFELATTWGHTNYWRFHKAIDFERGIEIFQIGGAMGIDMPFEGPIFCLKQNADYIPFTVEYETETATAPISAFNCRDNRYINPLVTFPEVDLTISNFGRDLKSIGLLRAELSYNDVWGDSEFHGYEFRSAADMNTAFRRIQEALPVLLFDNYESSHMPRPVLCRHVVPFKDEAISEFDGSGAIEAMSVVLRPPLDDPEGPTAVLDRLEQHNEQAPIRIEEFMKELLSLERGRLFFGHSFSSAMIGDDRIVPILRRSFDAYYTEHYSCFERFFSMIEVTERSRQTARAVYASYPRPPRRTRRGK